MHKFHNGKIPAPPQLNLIQDVHGYNTRLSKRQNYYQNFNRLNIGQSSCIAKGLKIWNDVPENFKKLPSLAFKTKMKEYFLEILNDSTQSY